MREKVGGKATKGRTLGCDPTTCRAAPPPRCRGPPPALSKNRRKKNKHTKAFLSKHYDDGIPSRETKRLESALFREEAERERERENALSVPTKRLVLFGISKSFFPKRSSSRIFRLKLRNTQSTLCPLMCVGRSWRAVLRRRRARPLL